MAQLLVIAGSNSTTSINLQLALYAAQQTGDHTITQIDLNDFEMPLFSIERETSTGIPEPANKFLTTLQAADGIVLSLAEHNGSYATAFKNVLDWVSRLEQKLWSEKPMLLLSTSPGGRGGASVCEAASQTFPHLGAKIAATFSLPAFYENFSTDTGVTDPALRTALGKAIDSFRSNIH